ncbi:MAG TPA: tyrosine-protein phosphatase [Bryobacteraceae bacterium]|nr:tyrosine-protein phosphatase [Bryobacteraceae bacterium]
MVRIFSALLAVIPVFAAQPGLRDFQQIDANVYRGRQPGPQGYLTLARMGIKTVIDLRGGAIHMPHERRLVESAGLRYVEERFSGIFAPQDRQIAKVLAVMMDPSDTPVFVHCRRGADRVGTLIACYRMVRDGWTNRQAFAEARGMHFSPLEVLMRRYIEHFDPARLKLPSPATAANGHLLQ